MKTKAFILVCLFLGVGLIQVAAQKNIKKTESVTTISGYLDCTGDWLSGTALCENIQSPHNYVFMCKKVEVKGYRDEACTIPSGNIYEFSQIVVGLDFYESTGKFMLNGKTIGVFHFWFHMTTDGTVVNDGFRIDCK